MSELDKILNKDEKILWQGKPQARIYFTESILPPLVIAAALIFLSNYLAPFISIIAVSPLDNSQMALIGTFRSILYGIVLLSAVASPVFSYLSWKYLLYALTDKRAIIQSGIIGRDFKMIDYDQFKDADVNVDLFDKIIGINTGTINIYTGEMGIKTTSSYYNGQLSRHQSSYRISYNFSHIEDPYKVFELFKKTSFDIKADINYPNKLRPGENTGYNTKYQQQETPPAKT